MSAPDPDTQRVLDLIEEAYRWKLTLGPIVLEDEYLHAIAKVEALPRNASGADKVWLARMIDASRQHFEEVRRTQSRSP